MLRVAAIAIWSMGLAGCAGKPEQPIGYTPEPTTETQRSEAVPTGGGGYDFGASLKTVRAKCSAQHGEFKLSGKVSSCTTSHPGAATQITLIEYCGGVVCRIHSVAILDRPDAKSWLASFEYLKRELEERYGMPDDRQIQFPADCETKFAACVSSGEASATLRWRWDDGHAVMLHVGAADRIPAAISVSYANSLATQKR